MSVQTILIPQPSDDPNDPLLWSPWKKHAILVLVGFGAFAGDFGLTAALPGLLQQGEEWGKTPTVVNYANNLGVLMIALSSLMWQPMTNIWGRIPVLFWTTFLGAAFTIGVALAPSYPVFYGMRALQCVNQGVGSAIGLAFVKDMFYYHEHARKIGIWYALFLCSPYFGPLFSNFMLARLGDWRPAMWLVFAWAASLTVLIFLFGDESWYNRRVPIPQQPARPQTTAGRVSRVLGVWQVQHHRGYYTTWLIGYSRLVAVLFKPIIPLTTVVYTLTFMWAIGLNQSSAILLSTPESQGGYGLSTIATAYVYFTPVVAVVMGEILGHYLNDYVVAWYTRRHQGIFRPEARLWACYIGGLFLVPALILIGQTLQHHLHYVGIIFGWGMHMIGIMVTSVAVVAYCLDCYPTASGEVSAILNAGRAVGGFGVPYFQQQWGAKDGFDVSFGVQAAITAFGFVLLAAIQLWGQRLRAWSGPLKEIS